MRVAVAVVAWMIVAVAVADERAADELPAFEPTEHYQVRDVRGWKVLVHRSLNDEHRELGARVIDVLDGQLLDIERMVPVAALAKLRLAPIWVEFKNRDVRCMCYHPSRDWLTANGFNPQKAQAVEIGHARNFLAWTKPQPSMVLHELAHAYHDRDLEGGYGNVELKQAYQRMKESKSYESVLHYNGNRERAYALNNPQEYFAELTEAWFGANDFYPFVRPEVKEHDPEMAKLLEKLWGGQASD